MMISASRLHYVRIHRIKMLMATLIFTILTRESGAIDEKTCLEESSFEYCKADKSADNLLWNLYVGHDLFFKIFSPGKCLSYGFIYMWELKLLSTGKVVQRFDKFMNRAVLTIKSDVLPCNEYDLQVMIKGTRKNTKTLNCWFRINTAGPVPIILDGRHRNAMNGDNVALDASTTDESGLANLKYSWRCTSNPPRPFCSKFQSKEKKTSIMVDGGPGATFDISLQISTENLLKTTHQVIHIVEDSLPLIRISCHKNCLGKGHIDTDPGVMLFLKASCTKNCDGVSFLWSSSPEIDEEYLMHGVTDSRFLVLMYTLDTDTAYEIQVKAIRKGKPTGAKAIWPLRTTVLPTKECDISPQSGTSIETEFMVKCSGPAYKRPLTYIVDQIYSKPEEEVYVGVFLAQSVIPRLSLLLAPEPRARQIITYHRDDKFVSSEMELDIDVKPLLSHLDDQELIKEVVRIYSGQTEYVSSVKGLARHGWSEKAIQVINCLLWELQHIKSAKLKREFLYKFKIKLIVDMLMFPPDSGIKGMLTLVPMFIDNTRPKKVHYGVMLSKLCKRLSGAVQLFISNAKYPMVKIRAIQEFTSILVECGDYLLDGKFQRTIGYDITTELPIEVHKVIEEDYPNYKDIVDTQLREKFVDITDNAMHILRECTHTFSMGLAYGESVEVGDTTKIFMQLGTTDEIEYAIYSDPGVMIELPKDLGVKKGKNIRMLFLSFDSDIYFWDDLGKNISTRIVDLDIYDEENNLISDLPDYIDAYMDIVSNKTEIVPIRGKTEAFGDSTEWTEEDITVYRIDVRENSQVFADIANVAIGGVQMVLTQNRRPSLEDFKDAIVVKEAGRAAFPPTTYDSWCYIGILPLKAPVKPKISPVISAAKYLWNKMTPVKSKESASYDYMFRAQSCLEWSGGKWTSRNCTLGKNTTTKQVHCRCTVLTAVAGITHVPTSKLDDIREINYKMKFVYTYFIFIMTAGVVLCYLIALCFILLRTISSVKEVYFLSDNVKDCRYAYWIIVRTGKGNYSGTSSNVMIKLIGEKRDSKAHVLNYPDPNRKLLQQAGEDWFVLTTSQHLGELTSILLWYDSIGNRATWYCDSICVCDLQLEKWWSFDVQRWFTISEPNQHTYKIETDVDAEIDVKKKNFLKYFRFHFEGDHTWNIFVSTNDSRLTYLERITVVFSNILLTYTLGLLIAITPEMRLRDGFNKHFNTSYLHLFAYAVAISMLSSGYNLLFVFCFRFSHRKYMYAVKSKKLLSDYLIKLTWSLLIASILLEVFYLAAFGFWTSDVACKAWFMMTTIAILLSAFLWENIYMSLTITFEKRWSKNEDIIYDYKAIIYDVEEQRKYLYTFTSFYGLRPYLTHLYRPLSDQDCERKKEKLIDRILLAKTLRDMLIFAIYLLCVFILAYENSDQMAIFHNNHIRAMMEAEEAEASLGEIASIEDIYSYINDSLIPTIHGLNWYGNWNVIDPGLMADFNTKVLGVARIRQKRVRPNSCLLTRFARKLNITRCNAELDPHTADRRCFRGQAIWTYHQPLETGITLTYGQIRDYSGGGYVVTVARSLSNAYYVVDRLLRSKWIDVVTRVLFVEFWTYNANSNLFNSVKVVIEYSATKYIAKSAEIYTSRLMHVDVQAEIIPVIIFSIFLIIVIYQIYNCVAGMVKQKLKFFKGFWNVLDLTILTLSIGLVVITMHRMEVLGELLDQLEKTKRNVFINYYPVIYYDKSLTLLSAFLICIATLRIWKYLRFGVMFRVFERTLVRQLRQMIGVFVYNIVVLVMYSLLGYIMFSSFSQNFRDLEKTFTCMTLLSLNLKTHDFDMETLQQYFPNVGCIFYISFTLIMLLIINAYITVIIIYYEDSVEYFTKQELKYSVLDYAKDEFRYLTKYFSRYLKSLRLKGGEDSQGKIQPKIHRYTDGLVIGEEKMKEMMAIAAGVSYNFLLRREQCKLNAADFRMMAQIAHASVHKSSDKKKLIFFTTEGDGRIRLVPDTRLLDMEKIVRKLLEEEEVYDITRERDALTDRISLRKMDNINKLLNIINNVVGNITVVSVKR